jgi:hypothetical protein
MNISVLITIAHVGHRMTSCCCVIGGRILKANRRLILTEMKRNKMKYATGALRTMDAVLRRQVRYRCGDYVLLCVCARLIPCRCVHTYRSLLSTLACRHTSSVC